MPALEVLYQIPMLNLNREVRAIIVIYFMQHHYLSEEKLLIIFRELFPDADYAAALRQAKVFPTLDEVCAMPFEMIFPDAQRKLLRFLCPETIADS